MIKKIKEYKVVESWVYADFERKVNTCLERGWLLCGGVSISVEPPDWVIYCQALVRDKNINVKKQAQVQSRQVQSR